MRAIQIKTTVLPGGRIEIQSADLPEGQEVEFEILIDDGPKQSFEEILAEFPDRGRSFKNAAEVDRYINEERDSWDK